MAKSNPFDWVTSINEKKRIDHVRGYNPYLTNMSLSYSLDTIMFANEMNKYPLLPAICQYDFLFGTIRKGRRFNKWHKSEENPHTEMIMEYFGYSQQKAIEALEILTEDDITKIKQSQDKGGTK